MTSRIWQEAGGRPIRIWTDDVEMEAKTQLANIAMPDVHHGKGATVGSVIATQGAIIPAAVGVDIGCGMNAVRTNLTSKFSA